MGQVFDSINEELADWIQTQKMFFVATAPLADGGLVNCSPKGLDTFRVLDPSTVAYLDFTGSGIETVAHLKENGRIVVMFCAFEGAPNIVRLHGTGTFHELRSERYKKLAKSFGEHPGVRGVIEIALNRISDSCGWGVPKYDFVEERVALTNSAIKKGEQGMADYRKQRNSQSLDGLPGF